MMGKKKFMLETYEQTYSKLTPMQLNNSQVTFERNKVTSVHNKYS